MNSRAWTAVIASIVGVAAAVVAAASGPVAAGSVAALACGVSAVTLYVTMQNRDRAASGAATTTAPADRDDAPPGSGLSGPGVASGLEVTVPALPVGPAEPDDSDIESVYDTETGLLDHRIFTVTFERKIAAARRHLRPLSLVLIDLGPGLPPEADKRNQALGRWGSVVHQALRDADVACRISDTTFGVICEDTAEAGAVWVAERLQIAVSCNAAGLLGPLRAAVATYPNHGLGADEILAKGWEALSRAQQSGADAGDRFGQVQLPSPEI